MTNLCACLVTEGEPQCELKHRTSPQPYRKIDMMPSSGSSWQISSGHELSANSVFSSVTSNLVSSYAINFLTSCPFIAPGNNFSIVLTRVRVSARLLLFFSVGQFGAGLNHSARTPNQARLPSVGPSSFCRFSTSKVNFVKININSFVF